MLRCFGSMSPAPTDSERIPAAAERGESDFERSAAVQELARHSGSPVAAPELADFVPLVVIAALAVDSVRAERQSQEQGFAHLAAASSCPRMFPIVVPAAVTPPVGLGHCWFSILQMRLAQR